MKGLPERTWLAVLWAALPLPLLGGCSGGRDRPVGVSGVVITGEGGQPVPRVQVTFTPVGESGRPAGGQTDEEGRFTLTTLRPNDGALPGEYKVVITPPPSGPPLGPPGAQVKGKEGKGKGPEEKKSQPPAAPIHGNYQNVLKTPLRQKVPPAGEVKFVLTRDGT